MQPRWFRHFKRTPLGRPPVELSHWIRPPEADPGPSVEMISHSWHGNIWRSAQQELNCLLKSALTSPPSQPLATATPANQSGTKTDTFRDPAYSHGISTSELFCMCEWTVAHSSAHWHSWALTTGRKEPWSNRTKLSRLTVLVFCSWQECTA